METKKEILLIKKGMKINTPKANNSLSMDELIDRVSILSKNKQPYSVAKEVDEIKSIFYIKLKLEKESNIDLNRNNKEATNTIYHSQEIMFKSVYDTYKKIKLNFRKNREIEQEKNYKIKISLIEDIDALSKEEESMKTTFEKFRTIQEKWRNTGAVQIKKNSHIWKSYQHHIELFYDYIKLNKDLRDLDFKRNLEEKNAICNKAEALLKEKSLTVMNNKLQELHEHWKHIGPVKKELREKLWKKFQNISKQLNKRRNDYFIKKKKEDAEKFELKKSYCNQIDNLTSEGIVTHDNWKSATDRCKNLQLKWGKIGNLERRNNKIACKNLKNSLDEFYNKRRNFYIKKNLDNKNIILNKIAICEKAESLQNSTNWKETEKKLIILQQDWKKSGFSNPRHSKDIWNRFNNACNLFFKAKKKYLKNLKSKKKDTLKINQNTIQKAKCFNPTNDTKKDINTLREFIKKWVETKHIISNKANDTFLQLINSKFSEIGLSKKMLEKELFKNKIILLKDNKKAIMREQQFFLAQIDILKKETLQYENNISFLSTGKNTDLLLKEVQKKIFNTKNKIEAFKQKLQLIKNI